MIAAWLAAARRLLLAEQSWIDRLETLPAKLGWKVGSRTGAPIKAG